MNISPLFIVIINGLNTYFWDEQQARKYSDECGGIIIIEEYWKWEYNRMWGWMVGKC